MVKTIRVLALSILLLFMGCVSSPPPAVVVESPPPAVLQDNSTTQRQKDDLWCRQFGTFGNSQEMYNETYKKCMERFGYTF